jgi:hypothetical protein
VFEKNGQVGPQLFVVVGRPSHPCWWSKLCLSVHQLQLCLCIKKHRLPPVHQAELCLSI